MNKKDYKLITNNMAETMTAHKLFGKVILALLTKSFREEEIEAFEPSAFIERGYSFSDYDIEASVNLVSPQLSMLYGDYTAVVESATLIGDSKAKRIHFGHGKTVDNKKWSALK